MENRGLAEEEAFTCHVGFETATVRVLGRKSWSKLPWSLIAVDIFSQETHATQLQRILAECGVKSREELHLKAEEAQEAEPRAPAPQRLSEKETEAVIGY